MRFSRVRFSRVRASRVRATGATAAGLPVEAAYGMRADCALSRMQMIWFLRKKRLTTTSPGDSSASSATDSFRSSIGDSARAYIDRGSDSDRAEIVALAVPAAQIDRGSDSARAEVVALAVPGHR